MFLGFIVSAKEVSADHDKLKTIWEWPEPKTFTEARSFHGLVSFYRRSIKGFNTITTPIAEYLRLGTFKWNPAAHKAYLDDKYKMIEAPVLWHLDFSKIFEVACDASGVGIEGVLSQDVTMLL